jgi:uncharacterized cupredoxin-like copper-binding protein
VARLTLWIAILLVIPGCWSSSSAAEQRVEVEMRYSRFLPAEFTFRVGETVTFVIRNNDPIDHEFILGDRRVQDTHEAGTHPAHGEVPGEVSVPAGATGTTTYTFTEPGELIIGCHSPRHYDYGMHARVRVLP